MNETEPNVVSATGWRVLLVEDDLELAETLRSGLREDRIMLDFAVTGQEALDALHRQAPDLVLLDLGLPGMDGFELLQRLQQQPAGQCPPVIVLTAKNSTGDKLRGFELGAVDYVTKPFELVELRARLRSTLRGQHLQKELLQANRRLDAARKVAEQAARSKAEFLANMSHEIRTPMNGVIAMTGLLMQTDLSADQRDLVDTIRSGGESLLSIINDILNFSKIESGKMELEFRPTNLRRCVEDSLDLLAAKAAEKNLDLVHQISSQVPEEVMVDGTRLRQILVNLLSNAIKFTHSGEICLNLSCQPLPAGNVATAGAGVEETTVSQRYEFHFSVRDTGMGIPPARLSRLFRSFSQVDSSISRQFGGTGLGLAISKGLVGLMGGRIWVDSVEGQGSTFHFTLAAQAVSSSIPEVHTAHPALAGQRVLLLEDGATARRLLAGQVAEWGMTPVEASNLEEMTAQSQAGGKLDFAVIDGGLPVGEGLTLGAELSKVFDLKSIPFVFLTSVGCTGLPVEFQGSRVVPLNKPVKPAQLQAALLRVRAGSEPLPKQVRENSKLDGGMADRLPLRILLTDDNVINRKVALRLLQQLGYTADTATNGLEALRAVEQDWYDVIFMDVQMPEMDGLEATQRIRQLLKETERKSPSGLPLVIVAMTANAMQGDREKCIEAGMDDYLAKPVRPEAIQKVLERHGAAGAKTAASTSPPEANPASSIPVQVPLTVLSEPESAPTPVATVVKLPGTGHESSGSGETGPTDGAAPAVPSPVDLERLSDFAGGSLENFNELVCLYFKQTAEQLQQIRDALGVNDAEQAARIAHSSAGASATCGMVSIVPFLRQLEDLGQAGNLAESAQLLPRIEREFELLKQYLDSHKPIALAG